MGRVRKNRSRQKDAPQHPERQPIPQHPNQQHIPQRPKRNPGIQKTFNCYRCSTVFTSHGGLMRHIHRDGCRRTVCHRCDALFQSRNQLKAHIRRRDCQWSSNQIARPMYPDRWRPGDGGGGGGSYRPRDLNTIVNDAVDDALARYSPYAVMNAVEQAFARNPTGYWLSKNEPPLRHFSNPNPVYVNHLTPNTSVLYQPPRYPPTRHAPTPDFLPTGSCAFDAHSGRGSGEIVIGGRNEYGLPQVPQSVRLQEYDSGDEMSIT